MRAIRARFDGEKVILPEEVQGASPGEVIIVFADTRNDAAEGNLWLRAQEGSFAKAWDNDEDAVYDEL